MKKMINLVLAITMVMGMLGIFAFDYVDGPLTVRADGVATDEVVTVEELQARIKELETDVAYYKEWYVEPYEQDGDELRIRLDYHLKDARVRLADGTYALRAVEVGENIVLDDVSEVSVLHNYREEFMLLPIENFNGQLKIAVTFDEGKTVELIDWGYLNTVNSLAHGEKVETGLKLKTLRKYSGLGRDHVTLYKYVACVVEDADSIDGFNSAIRVKAKVECIRCEHLSEEACKNAKCECDGCDCYVKPHCNVCSHNNAWVCINAKCVCTGCNCYTAPVVPKHCENGCHASEEECKNAKCECTYCDCYTAPVIPQHCKKNCHASEEACKNAKCECTYCDCYDAPKKHCDHCEHDSKEECINTKCECTYCDCYTAPDYNDANPGFGDLVDDLKGWPEGSTDGADEETEGDDVWPEGSTDGADEEAEGNDVWPEGSTDRADEEAEGNDVWPEGSTDGADEEAEGNDEWTDGTIDGNENLTPAYTEGGSNIDWFLHG